MKTVKFTNIHLEHFGKHENIQSKLGHRTVIEGANATGKSTIKRAIQYILGTKDENGKEISGIRPHDENGVDIDGLTTVAELTVSVDGTENTLKRTCFQEKNRQQQYTGKDNLQYFVDDVKKGTKKAYDEFVSTVIPNPVCIYAYELLSKETETRRKLLEDTFSTHSNDDVIDMYPEYEELRGKLRANTTKDLKSALRKKRDGYKEGGKKVPGLIDEREKVIHQIEFEQSQKVDIDLDELELHRNALNEQINEVKAKQANVDKQFEEYDRQSKDILDLHFELNGLQQKANEELHKNAVKLTEQQLSKEEEIKTLQMQMWSLEYKNKDIQKSLEMYESKLNSCREKWKQANERVFDKNSLICSYCGQEYPQDKKEQLRAEFESHKAEELKNITLAGEEMSQLVKDSKKALEENKKQIDDLAKQIEKLQEELKKIEEEQDKLPQSIDISDREDVKQLKQQIAEKEQAMQKGNSASEIRQQLQDELEDLQRQKAEVVGKMNLSVKNDGIDERVAELKKQQLALSQEIADVDRELDLLKQFERKKAELLGSDVNENFDLVQFRMFEQQQNGDLKDVCHILVDGESYDRNLNFSNRLLAEVDICRGFQRKYDVELPILLDNAESISSNRLPDIPNQLIMFRVPYIPEKPLVSKEGMTEEEWQKAVAEWEEEKKRIEEYYSELRIECLEG